MNMHTQIVSHEDIIRQAGGYKGLAERLGLDAELVRFWERRASIPDTYWLQVRDAGVATLDALAEAAAHRRARQTT